MFRKWIILGLIFVAGCASEAASPEGEEPRPIRSMVGDMVSSTYHGALAAIASPFEDIGIKRTPIPPKLQQVALDPYAVPMPLLCDGLRREITELDVLLGPDECTPQSPTGAKNRKSTRQYMEKGSTMASEQAVGMVRGHVDIIPYRGIVRKVSGAEKHAKAVALAYQAGKLRRAYLKGLGNALGPECLAPPLAKMDKADKDSAPDESKSK